MGLKVETIAMLTLKFETRTGCLLQPQLLRDLRAGGLEERRLVDLLCGRLVRRVTVAL